MKPLGWTAIVTGVLYATIILGILGLVGSMVFDLIATMLSFKIAGRATAGTLTTQQTTGA